MGAEDIKRHAQLLKIIFRADPKTREQILRLADKRLIKLLCEISKNTLAGKISLTQKDQRNLLKYKKQLRKISTKGNWLKKKKLFLQSGGGGLIAALLGPLISTVISRLLK